MEGKGLEDEANGGRLVNHFGFSRKLVWGLGKYYNRDVLRYSRNEIQILRGELELGFTNLKFIIVKMIF